MKKRRAFDRGNRLRSQVVDGRSLRQLYAPSRVVGPRDAVLVSGQRIVFGGRAEGSVRAWMIDRPVPESTAEAFADIEEAKWSWAGRMLAITLLRSLGLDRATIGSLVGMQTTLVSRLLGLPSAVLALLRLVDDGRLTVSHVVALGELADSSSAETWAGRCIAGAWSVRELRAKLSGGTVQVAELDRLASSLGEQLGTSVSVVSAGAEVRVSLAWFGAGDLLGLMRKLSDASGTGGPEALGSKRRSLELVLSVGEFDCVFGHLVGDQ
ncbi:hypothetical protein C7S18_23650 (plasmid) [Ahniella affigens]|uniref:ParB/Spo0J HTH domain-containing protein n=1 Tax=Ahniella affigens TaxID=2021234 RepID=A0A2P1PZQ5_9GAMM|nr:hypothetical protein C7S18_23650 [Ahniella affigens]